jgi:hypothetical protein
MKLAALIATTAVVGAVAASATAAAPSAHAGTAKPPCTPKIAATKGHGEVEYCGPATATLTIAGKTYTFKNGYCENDPAAKFTLQLTLGTIVEGEQKGNLGMPLFELNLISSSIKIDTVTADSGGKTLTSVGAVAIKGSLTNGTFASTKSFLNSTPFSGSWNCHGPIYYL